jgi:hypothetical protein
MTRELPPTITEELRMLLSRVKSGPRPRLGSSPQREVCCRDSNVGGECAATELLTVCAVA